MACLLSKEGFTPLMSIPKRALERINLFQLKTHTTVESQELVGVQLPKLGKYTDDFTSLFSLQFTDTVVGFYNFSWFDEDCFPVADSS